MEYAILWHIPKKKKKSEISKYEISNLTTCMVLAKGKKKKSSFTVSFFNSLTDLTTRINLKTPSISLFLADAV